MTNYPVTVTYKPTSQTETLHFYVKAATKNDAWLSAVSKAWTLFNNSTVEIVSIAVSTPPVQNSGD